MVKEGSGDEEEQVVGKKMQGIPLSLKLPGIKLWFSATTGDDRVF